MTNQSTGTPGPTDREPPAVDSILLTVARSAAREAAAIIRDAAPRRGSIVWQEKSATDFVSEVDLAAEAAGADDEQFFHGIRARSSATVRHPRTWVPVTVTLWS